jgi:hypothetical protein
MQSPKVHSTQNIVGAGNARGDFADQGTTVRLLLSHNMVILIALEMPGIANVDTGISTMTAKRSRSLKMAI